MTEEEVLPHEPFQCTHCNSLGEIPFSSFKSQQQQVNVKVWVNNLPEGITESGVKNLFLTSGKPLSISFNPRNKSALVEFHLLNEAELAVRDLHCKPPYNLRVTFATPKFRNGDDSSGKENQSESSKTWDFSSQEDQVEIETENTQEKTNEVVEQIKCIIKSLPYDPSIRMRQKKLDFRTDVECVSLGRGYLNRGKTDYFVGGLQKFISMSEESKAKNEMSYFCENCQALTTKICSSCSAPYCSKECLSKSIITDHRKCSNIKNLNSREESHLSPPSHQLPSDSLSSVPLTSGCTVVMSTFFTMQRVAVRRTDKPWEEKFTRLCNDIAAEAFKGRKLEEMPREGDLVIGRYHEDLCFYRARVVSHSDSKVGLIFIDFGNFQETDLEDLKPLPDDFKSVPGLAVKVDLKDVPDDSSLESVKYFNKLTAEGVLLILKLEEEGGGGVELIEKESKTVVNETVKSLVMASWRKDSSVLSKLGEVLYLSSLERKKLEIGRTCNLIVSHFDDKEFLEWNGFWVTDPESDDFLHAHSQMYLKIREYCEYLKDDFYLPRTNELCLAKEDGEWFRCVNLKSCKTTCYLFFVDDGHSSLVETRNIRKMIPDFAEAPSQAVCCTLPDDPKLKTNKELRSKAAKYLEESTGQTIQSVVVLKMVDDAYCLSVPEIKKILA